MRSLESIIKANKHPAPSPRYASADDLRVRHILERGQRLDFLRAVQQRDAERPVYVQSEEEPVKSWRDLPKEQRDARMDAFERDLRPVRRS